ncbi:hypothetical protein V6N11_056281 [Hibiscus sabdariffa]|uniref:DUF4283 domain-containing protein n=1 Tax=Hibiscus sabdariffa TaxID=183260 RepID=A0ABR2T3D2_9ROSI
MLDRLYLRWRWFSVPPHRLAQCGVFPLALLRFRLGIYGRCLRMAQGTGLWFWGVSGLSIAAVIGNRLFGGWTRRFPGLLSLAGGGIYCGTPPAAPLGGADLPRTLQFFWFHLLDRVARTWSTWTFQASWIHLLDRFAQTWSVCFLGWGSVRHFWVLLFWTFQPTIFRVYTWACASDLAIPLTCPNIGPQHLQFHHVQSNIKTMQGFYYFWRLLSAWTLRQVPGFLYLELFPLSSPCSFPRSPCSPILPGGNNSLAVFFQLYLYGKGLGILSHILRASCNLLIHSCILLLHMDSELIYSMENLQFTEAETASVVFEPPCDDGDSALWLVGSVVSNKPVNGDSVSRIFRSVWKSKHVSEILELRPNFFLIKPTGKDSKDMILKRRPWVVHEDLFSIEPYIPTWRAADFDFNNMTIWVRVFQLPLQAMNGTMGLQLGGCIGRAIGVDHRVEGCNLGEFLRIRVSIDITKPLWRYVLLGNGQGRKPTPYPLKYERLPRFCYFCGLIGHDLAVCQAKPTDLDHRKLQYGSWLRVSVQQPVAGARRRQGIEYFDSKTVSPGIATEATGRNPPSAAESGSTCDLPNPHGDGPPRADTPQPSNVSVPTTADGPIPPAAPAQTIVKGNAVLVPADISSTTNVGSGLASMVASKDLAAAAARGHSATKDSPSKASDAPLATEGITRPEHSVCSSPTLPIPVAEVPPSPWPVNVVPDQVNGKQAIVFTAGGRDVVLPSSQAAKEPGLSLPISAVEVKHSEGNKGAESGWFLSISAAVSNPVRAKRSLQGKYEPVWATVTAASLLHGDFLAANDNGQHPCSRPILSTPTWSPPPSGTIAISVDGAFIQAQGAGIGVVARDSAGRVLGGFAQHSVAPGSSALAEAAAVLAGLRFAGESPSGGPPGRRTAEHGGPGSSLTFWNDFPWSNQMLMWSNRMLVIGRPITEEAVRILGTTHPPGPTQEAVGASAIWIGLCGLSLLTVMLVDTGAWRPNLDIFGWDGEFHKPIFGTYWTGEYICTLKPNLFGRCWSWGLLIPLSVGWPGPTKFLTGLPLFCLNWATPGWILSFPAWSFPSPIWLETKSGYLLLVWRLAQTCWAQLIRFPGSLPRGRVWPFKLDHAFLLILLIFWVGHVLLGDTHLHDRLLGLLSRRPRLYLTGRSLGLFSLISCFSSHFFLTMDSELLHSMENLQFTEAESGSVVMESPGDEGESSLWLGGSVVSNKTVKGDSVCRIFRSVWKPKYVSETLNSGLTFFSSTR